MALGSWNAAHRVSWLGVLRQTQHGISRVELEMKVTPLGLEPRTHGLKVHCSTN